MKSNTLELLRQNINKYRLSKNLTQEKLSEISDISSDYLSEIERGKRIPSLKRLLLIADALNVEIYKFFISEE